MNADLQIRFAGFSKTKIAFLGLFCGFVVAYWPVLCGLVSVWYTSDEYSFVFFMIPAGIYIIWKKRDILRGLIPNPSQFGLVLIVISLLIYLLSHLAEIESLAALTLIPCLYGIVLYLFGWRILKEVFFPISTLIFAIPVPAQIYAYLTVPLQLLVSLVGTAFAAFLNIPILREGNIIHIPERTFQVADACSGLRSLVSIMALSTIIGHFLLRSIPRQLILFLSAVPVAIAANIFRVYMLIVVFYYFHIDLAHGAAHTVLGSVIYLIAIIGIIVIAGVLSRWNSPVRAG